MLLFNLLLVGILLQPRGQRASWQQRVVLVCWASGQVASSCTTTSRDSRHCAQLDFCESKTSQAFESEAMGQGGRRFEASQGDSQGASNTDQVTRCEAVRSPRLTLPPRGLVEGKQRSKPRTHTAPPAQTATENLDHLRYLCLVVNGQCE